MLTTNRIVQHTGTSTASNTRTVRPVIAKLNTDSQQQQKTATKMRNSPSLLILVSLLGLASITIIEAWISTMSSTGQSSIVSSSTIKISRVPSRWTTTRRSSLVTILHAAEGGSSNTRKQKSATSDMLNFIEDPVESKDMVGDAAQTHGIPPEQDDLAPLVKCIVKAADGRKADDIVALRVSRISTVTSFVVFVSGNSRPQNQAIAAAIQGDVRDHSGQLPGSTGVPEGTADSGWMVLDYGSVMVHIMTPKSRLFYNVEGSWRDKGGEEMDLTDVIMPNVPVGTSSVGNQNGAAASATQGPGRMEDLSEEEDPFWS